MPTGRWSFVGGVVVVVGFLLPWLTWMLLTTPNPHLAVTQTPFWLFLMGMLLVGCAVVLRLDPWLGALVGYLLLRSVWPAFSNTFEAALVVTMGACALVSLRFVPLTWHKDLATIFTVGGVLQVGYVAIQAFGYDPIWMGVTHGTTRLLGTLGNENYVGAYVGMLMPLAPLWALPVLALGLILTHSMNGALAASVGLLVRFRRSRLAWGGVALLLAIVLWRQGVASAWLGSSIQTRWIVWQAAIHDLGWWQWLWGYGLGGWGARLPNGVQPWVGVGEWFAQAHNDYLQLLYEGGLVAVGLLGAWLWRHRQMFAHPRWGGAAAAVLATALFMFPFHLAVLGLTGLIILGLATCVATQEDTK